MKWQTKVHRGGEGGVKQNSSGVKHFLEGVKKNLGEFNQTLEPFMK